MQLRFKKSDTLISNIAFKPDPRSGRGWLNQGVISTKNDSIMSALPETLEDKLIHEVWRQDLVAVNNLLHAGANPNLPSRTCSSAITYAGESDETGEIAKMLVAAGADINLKNDRGLTPLDYAVDVAIDGAIQNSSEEIDWFVVGIFLGLGADHRISANKGETTYRIIAAYSAGPQKSFDIFMHGRHQ